jgi:hypothetical protein
MCDIAYQRRLCKCFTVQVTQLGSEILELSGLLLLRCFRGAKARLQVDGLFDLLVQLLLQRVGGRRLCVRLRKLPDLDFEELVQFFRIVARHL